MPETAIIFAWMEDKSFLLSFKNHETTFLWREYVFKFGTGYPACSKTRASRNRY
jgi:hypothetical protein